MPHCPSAPTPLALVFPSGLVSDPAHCAHFGHSEEGREHRKCYLARKNRGVKMRQIWRDCYSYCLLTSAMESSNLAIVSRLFNFAFSMASSLTRTASILDTMLPMECSMRSTRRLRLKHKRQIRWRCKAFVLLLLLGINTLVCYCLLLLRQTRHVLECLV